MKTLMLMMITVMSSNAHALISCKEIDLTGQWHTAETNRETIIEFCKAPNGALHQDDQVELCLQNGAMSQNLTVSYSITLDRTNCVVKQNILSATTNVNGGEEEMIKINAPKYNLKVVDLAKAANGGRKLVLAPCHALNRDDKDCSQTDYTNLVTYYSKW